jgi:hypothetical protein
LALYGHGAIIVANRRQSKQFGFNERIIGLLDKFPIHGGLAL